jgi:hypothetical protein
VKATPPAIVWQIALIVVPAMVNHSLLLSVMEKDDYREKLILFESLRQNEIKQTALI